MDGLLIIDKPAGPTSHDVVARARRLLGERRIGHTGTLNPTARGVLPLVVGRATRLARFVAAGPKRYEAVVRLGVATDTYDAAGRVTGLSHDGPMPDRQAIESALSAFLGTFSQRPPAYSAKKLNGTSAYALARRQQARVPEAVPVTLYRLEIVEMTRDTVTLDLECSAGFYVRSLAHDLGRALGIGAHLHGLQRTASGGFRLTDALPLAEAERDPQAAVNAVIPLERMLPDLPSVPLTEEGARRALHGRDLGQSDWAAAGAGAPRPSWPAVRLLAPGGRLVAVARFDAASGLLHPSVVLG